MSRLRADIVVNKNATGPFEASEGISIPDNKDINLGGYSGSDGEYIKKTLSGITWGELPVATYYQKGLVQIGTGLTISDTGVLNVNFDGTLAGLSDTNFSSPLISGQVLKYNGSNWTAAADTSFSGDYTDLINLPSLTLDEITGRGNVTANPITVGGLNVIGELTGTVLNANKLSNNTAPASASAVGTAGEIRYDSNYLYVCVSANTWKRTLLETWV